MTLTLKKKKGICVDSSCGRIFIVDFQRGQTFTYRVIIVEQSFHTLFNSAASKGKIMC